MGEGSLQSTGSHGGSTLYVQRAEERTWVQTLQKDHVVEGYTRCPHTDTSDPQPAPETAGELLSPTVSL